MDPRRGLYASSPAVQPSKAAPEVEPELLELMRETSAETIARNLYHDQNSRSSVFSSQDSFVNSQEDRPSSLFSVSIQDFSSQSSLGQEDATQPYDPYAEWESLRLQEHAKRWECRSGPDLESAHEIDIIEIYLSNEDYQPSPGTPFEPETPKTRSSRVLKSIKLRKLSLYCHMYEHLSEGLKARRDNFLSSANRTDQDDMNCRLVPKDKVKGYAQTVHVTITWRDFHSFGTNESQTLNIQVGILNMILERTMTPEQVHGWVHDGWELSHLCGLWRCIFWTHHIMEPKIINLERKSCHSGKRDSPCPHSLPCLFRDEYGYPRPIPERMIQVEVKSEPKFYHKQERKSHGIRYHQYRKPATAALKPNNKRKRKRDVASETISAEADEQSHSKQRKYDSSGQDMLAVVEFEPRLPNGEFALNKISGSMKENFRSRNETWEAQYGKKVFDSSKRPRTTERIGNTKKGAPALSEMVVHLIRKLDREIRTVKASRWIDEYTS